MSSYSDTLAALPAAKPSRLISFLRFSWATALVLAATALLLKVILALGEIKNWHDAVFTIAVVLAILAMIYVLFIAEGMILVAVQIEPQDQDRIEEYLQTNHNKDWSRLSAISQAMQSSYDRFVVGRQVIAVAVVVGLVFIVRSLDARTDGWFVQQIDKIYAGLGRHLVLTLNDDIVLFLITTLLPCWICQLLPHFLAKERSLEFSKLFFAKTLTEMSIKISGLEAGWPSFMMLQRIQKTKRFKKQEEISVGSAAIFRALAAYYGSSVTERQISIACLLEETVIDDKIIWEFRSGATSDINYSVKVPAQSQIRVIKWLYDFPVINKGEPVTNALSIATSVLGKESSQEGQDDARQEVQMMPTNSDGDTSDVDVELIEEYLLTTIIPLQMPIPRKGYDSEVVGITVKYATAPISTDVLLDNEEGDLFGFEIGKPTKCLNITIRQAPGTFIRPPQIGLQPAEELPFFTKPRLLGPREALPTAMPDGWQIAVPYPPVGARVFIRLDARLLS